MVRMEIALILIMAFVAYMYFTAERKHSSLHKTFSLLLIVVIVHLIFDAVTIYTVNHLDNVPKLWNDILHRCFVATMVFVLYLFYQYIAILVEEETGKARRLDLSAKIFWAAAEVAAIVLPIYYVETPAGNYSAGSYAYASYAGAKLHITANGRK